MLFLGGCPVLPEVPLRAEGSFWSHAFCFDPVSSTVTPKQRGPEEGARNAVADHRKNTLKNRGTPEIPVALEQPAVRLNSVDF